LRLTGKLDTPHGITVSSDGNIFIADMGSHRILSIDQSGNVKPVCGTGRAGTETEALNKPAAVLVNGEFLWIADLENHQLKVLPLMH